MGKRGKGSPQEKAREAAEAAKPYVQRVIEDDELRANLREAYESARDAYGRAADGKEPSKVLEDKKLQANLKSAAESLRSVSEALREPEKKRRRRREKRRGRRLGRLLVVAFAGAVLAIALSEDIRKAVLDKLFGAEEEFEYTSTTAPPAPASAEAP